MACVGGGIDVNWLVLAAACCVRGLVSGGGRGGGGVGVALLVVGGAGVGVVLAGGLGVPVGRVGVACVRRAALAVLDWLWCRGVGGRRRHITSSLRWPGWLYACMAAMTAGTKHLGTTSFPLHLIFPLYKAQFRTYPPFCNCLYTEDH